MIFVDTSFWVAYKNTRDSRQPEALQLYQVHRSGSLLTSNHVLGETWTFLNTRAGHRDAVEFLDMVEESGTRLLRTPEELEHEALVWLRRHDERRYSFVDATSFALMRELGIREALAFDSDFSAAGFIELRA